MATPDDELTTVLWQVIRRAHLRVLFERGGRRPRTVEDENAMLEPYWRGMEQDLAILQRTVAQARGVGASGIMAALHRSEKDHEMLDEAIVEHGGME